MKWKFWIDRGGTFTDIVGVSPDNILVTKKLLSKNPHQYEDATIAGIKELLGIDKGDPIPTHTIECVKIGTTVATNALLERKGAPTALVTTKGFGDALRIGYQNRPKIFALNIQLPEQLYKTAIEVDERITARGDILVKIDPNAVEKALHSLYDEGFRSIAIAFMHGYAYPEHEQIAKEIAHQIGFTQISVSHEVMPLIKFVCRGETTAVDAYLSPLLRSYIEFLKHSLHDVPIYFMQSNGGLAPQDVFRGRDSILSGPAGGVVGMVETGKRAGFQKIIGFDMGGTSTDVSHYAGNYEYLYESEIGGVKLRSPMLNIHTIAAGGGSILHFENGRYVVGPDSAGADPGPACYRQGGPLTITDCNVLLGRIQPNFFPTIFGPQGNQAIDSEIVKEEFTLLRDYIAEHSGKMEPIEKIAEGFLRIAIENMANAIKKISTARGYNVREYLLNGFGGAAGQHICRVADALQIDTILLHPNAGVLSAVGIGMAEFRQIAQKNVEQKLKRIDISAIETTFAELRGEAIKQLTNQGIDESAIKCLMKVHLRYEGTDSSLTVPYAPLQNMEETFRTSYHQQFGFIDPDRDLVASVFTVEASASGLADIPTNKHRSLKESKSAMPSISLYMHNRWISAPLVQREGLDETAGIEGPALIIEANTTTVIEPGWKGTVQEDGNILIRRTELRSGETLSPSAADPILLEIFNNRFMNIAEQMGVVLQNSASSVNIKERLDFSCALFDGEGELVANAPHIPIHLGSMSASVKSVKHHYLGNMHPGDAFITNDPYHGGTHLPDITVITPIFDDHSGEILFYAASRGHHTDIGGITPGSMPANSRSIHEEGAYIRHSKIVEKGIFQRAKIEALFKNQQYPARNIAQNIEDLKAQMAANNNGVKNLHKLCEEFSKDIVLAYMRHVRSNARLCVQNVLKTLDSGAFVYPLDNGGQIAVKITVNRETATAVFDFAGTSDQLACNFNAPKAVTIACILYVLRCLVNKEIPLNSGCLEPITLLIPEGSLLNPNPPAPVVAGNVETSQNIVDAILGALHIMAASQGTTNSFTFGKENIQYYETICGGAGAGNGFCGASAVHTHITNTRLTDPEILEWRFPVLLESFSIRKNSGGKGRYCGGEGAIRRIRFFEPMKVNILSSHRVIPPFGMAGGEPGKIGGNWIERADGSIEQLEGCACADMEKNDRFVIETPGGGGFGI